MFAEILFSACEAEYSNWDDMDEEIVLPQAQVPESNGLSAGKSILEICVSDLSTVYNLNCVHVFINILFYKSIFRRRYSFFISSWTLKVSFEPLKRTFDKKVFVISGNEVIFYL